MVVLLFLNYDGGAESLAHSIAWVQDLVKCVALNLLWVQP